MATKDTSSSTQGSGSSLTTSSIAVAANGNRVLYFCVMLGTTSVSVSSIIRDGQSATKIAEKNTGSTCRQEVWRIIAPNTGSATAAVSLSGSAGEIIVGWYSAYNVPQATPNSTPVIAESTSYTYIEADVSASSADDIVLGFVGWDRGGSTNTTFGSGQASEYNNVATGWRGGALTSKPGSGGTVNINASGAPPSGAPGNLIAFALGHEVPAGPTATLAGTLDTITGAIVAGAADVSATLAGTLDSITGNLAAGGNTGRLTSALPLRDAARLVFANRSDLVVHVLGKPGLGSVILLNAQSITSGLWTAPGPFIPGNRYNVMYELAGEPIGCEIITAGAV